MRVVIRSKFRLGYRAIHYVAVQTWLDHNSLPQSCPACGRVVTELGSRRGQGSVHHRDEDIYNNAPENLQLVCVTCHHSRHHRGVAKPAQGIAASKRWKGTKKTEEHKQKLKTRAVRQFSSEDEYMRWYARTFPGSDPLLAWKIRQRKLARKQVTG